MVEPHTAGEESPAQNHALNPPACTSAGVLEPAFCAPQQDVPRHVWATAEPCVFALQRWPAPSMGAKLGAIRGGLLWTGVDGDGHGSLPFQAVWTPVDAYGRRLEIYGSEGIRACANAAIAPSMTNTGKIIPDVMPSSVRITPAATRTLLDATSNGNTRYKVWKGTPPFYPNSVSHDIR